ncbi:glycosyltransferase family 2 protein [Wenzhouxiangella marina]|uniref:glycosyltransferase family 2 protein n=1 Tax=Wenzhouxiangella marina TaxID=1579979 RepID=UPI0006736903|nr:glycosyltransferase family 2 protein [Wenzhouxiangella marina]MBB6087885.1 rhamnosyltransferase [Wenzhouxiangella marina]
MSTAADTGAVIVAFHPDLDRLRSLIDTVSQQVERVIVVDNGPGDDFELEGRAGVEIDRAGANLGVAAALNRGIEGLRRAGVRRALLLDQDSRIEADFVGTLARELDRQRQAGRRVAAIGARVRDHDDRHPAPFIRFRLPFNQRLDGEHGSVDCDFLITSGSLLDLDYWTDIGPMREAWFIDNIDLEWCFRARRKGYAILGCHEAVLAHRIGERERLFGFIAYRRHAPERLYTMMRNRVFLYRSGAPRAWVVQDALRALGKLGLFALIAPRRAHLKAMLGGLRDGWTTRPLP